MLSLLPYRQNRQQTPEQQQHRAAQTRSLRQSQKASVAPVARGRGSPDCSLSSALWFTFSCGVLEERPVHVLFGRYLHFPAVHLFDELNWRLFDDSERLALRTLAHHQCGRCSEGVCDIRHRDLELATE